MCQLVVMSHEALIPLSLLVASSLSLLVGRRGSFNHQLDSGAHQGF